MDTIKLAKACREVRAKLNKLPRVNTNMVYEDMEKHREIVIEAEKKYNFKKGFLFVIMCETKLWKKKVQKNKFVSLDWLDDSMKIKEKYLNERL